MQPCAAFPVQSSAPFSTAILQIEDDPVETHGRASLPIKPCVSANRYTFIKRCVIIKPVRLYQPFHLYQTICLPQPLQLLQPCVSIKRYVFINRCISLPIVMSSSIPANTPATPKTASTPLPVYLYQTVYLSTNRSASAKPYVFLNPCNSFNRASLPTPASLSVKSYLSTVNFINLQRIIIKNCLT